jgi:hypothetical protein
MSKKSSQKKESVLESAEGSVLISTPPQRVKSGNRVLSQAKKAKQDEFYTQLSDIENELRHYKSQLKGKTIFCNCDDPYESNFFKYFILNFNALGLKRLITTSFKPSPIANTQLVLQPSLFGGEPKVVSKPDKPKGRPKVTANKFIINEVIDLNGDGSFDLRDVAEQLKANKHNEWTPLEGDGDFRSPECVELLKEADIVVTNPPFSLFREYVAQLVEHQKQFLIIGNKNAITYKEIFKLIKENKLWIGSMPMGRDMLFSVPDVYAKRMVETGNAGSSYRIIDGKVFGRSPSIWFTNIDNAKRHEYLPLFKRYHDDPDYYPKYDNYNAIEVSKTAEIPADYDGAMGVPITFLDKYNPEQFEILGIDRYVDGNKTPNKRFTIGNNEIYARVIIKRKK